LIDFDYAGRQIAGVWKMIWKREGWESEIDRSVDGVFRSFQAMILVFPIVLAGRFSFRRAAERIPEWQASPLADAPYVYAIGAQMLGFYLDWIVSITILLFAARSLGASRRAGDLLIGYNWAHVPISIAQTIPLVLFSLDGGKAYGAVAYLPAIAFIIAVLWGVIRRGMNAKPAAAAGLIAMLTVAGLFLDAIIGMLAEALYQPAG